MRKLLLGLSLFTVITTLSACMLGVNDDELSVTVYSERHYDTDQALYDAFYEETNIKVNIVSAGADELINRLDSEGEDTQADLLMIADAGRLYRAKDLELLQTVESDELNANIPQNYRDVDGMWYGLTKRARILVYHPERVEVDELSTYEALTEEAFNNRVVTRTSGNIYNQSLMASFVAIMGEEGARDFASGLVNNFARTPQGNDRDQAKAVMEGIADVAIMNTYYMGRMLNSTDPYEREVAETLRVFFPNQETTGTHVNISAAGVTRHAKNKDAAVQLLEFLSSEQAQESFANANYEYPVNEAVALNPLLESWGDFKAQDIQLNALGEYAYQAAIIMDEEGWE